MGKNTQIEDHTFNGTTRDKEEAEFSYFQVQASWGATKHMGGFKASRDLVQMCKIGPGKHILEVGCGVGMTTWRLAKEFDCILIGVDISEVMVDWSRKRAAREDVADSTEFSVADAQELPFENGKFDMVNASRLRLSLRISKRHWMNIPGLPSLVGMLG